jgi:hypothetical protein
MKDYVLKMLENEIDVPLMYTAQSEDSVSLDVSWTVRESVPAFVFWSIEESIGHSVKNKLRQYGF